MGFQRFVGNSTLVFFFESDRQTPQTSRCPKVDECSVIQPGEAVPHLRVSYANAMLRREGILQETMASRRGESFQCRRVIRLLGFQATCYLVYGLFPNEFWTRTLLLRLGMHESR
jgi:hypothetical protein